MTMDCDFSSSCSRFQDLEGRQLRGAADAQSSDLLDSSNHANLRCLVEIDSAPCGAIPLVRRNRERIVGCGQEGASAE